jgi:transposase InsO family protein
MGCPGFTTQTVPPECLCVITASVPGNSSMSTSRNSGVSRMVVDTRTLGREEGMRQRRRGGRSMGSDYLHVAIDGASRVAYVEAQPDQRAETAAAVLLRAAAFFAAQGVTIERVLTDRALIYTKSRPFRRAIDDIGARHKLTRPYRPQTNGKAERFIRTLVEEWAYIRFYPDNQNRLASLSTWVEIYNQRRPHTALGGKPPMAALVNHVCGNYT